MKLGLRSISRRGVARILFGCMVWLWSGCATLHFSAHYYTPPQHYTEEVEQIWKQTIASLPLLYEYTVRVVADNAYPKMKGIPHILGNEVRLPDFYIRYVYQNYYNDRQTVLTNTIVHELCHREYALHDCQTPQLHFAVDHAAIEMLKRAELYSPQDYYKSLYVLRNYWFARKGVMGHVLNVGWNVANIACLIFVGRGYFKDWYATDVAKRMQLCARTYDLLEGMQFTRSRSR